MKDILHYRLPQLGYDMPIAVLSHPEPRMDPLAQVEKLYLSAHDPDLWRGALHELAESLGAVGGMFTPERAADCAFGLEPSREIEEGCEIYVGQEWFKRDLRTARGWPLGRWRKVLLEHDLSTEEERHRHPYYQEFLRKQGLGWWAGIQFQANGQYWSLSLQRSLSGGPYSPNDARLLSHISGAVRASVEARNLFFQRNMSVRMTVLSQLGVAAVLVDWSGRAIAVNVPAEALMTDDFRVVANRLVASDVSSSARLEALIKAAVSFQPLIERASLRPVSIRRKSGCPAIVRALPIDEWGLDRRHFARAILVITDGGGSHLPHGSLLRDAFGLTAAEIRLCLAIASGESLSESAERFHLSKLTVRTQLKSIFAKTGWRRQSDLVAQVQRFGRSSGAT